MIRSWNVVLDRPYIASFTSYFIYVEHKQSLSFNACFLQCLVWVKLVLGEFWRHFCKSKTYAAESKKKREGQIS